MSVVLLLLAILVSIKHTQEVGSPVLRAIAEQQDDIARAADNAEASNNRILDCTTPTGTCSRRSAARLATTIGSLNAVTVQSAACAVDLILARHETTPTRSEIERAVRACVVGGLHPGNGSKPRGRE
jgi:hypothetical protein